MNGNINFGQVFINAIALTAFCASAYAEQTVYKWVDENGVVHFGDAPPAESNPDETATLTIPKSRPNVTPAQPMANPPAVSATPDEIRSQQPETETPQVSAKIDVTKMSLDDLDVRCEEAREKMIAPLREAEIAKCEQDERDAPSFCEQFNVDFGDGGRTISGSIRPRMFDDLPECVEALQEQNRRGR